MSENQNCVIAEALTAQGFDEGLAWGYDKLCEDGHRDSQNMENECLAIVTDGSEWGYCWKKVNVVRQPHDFTDHRYLRPAVKAVCDRNKWHASEEYLGDGEYIGHVYSTPESTEVVFVVKRGEHGLTDTFAAALTGGAQ